MKRCVLAVLALVVLSACSDSGNDDAEPEGSTTPSTSAASSTSSSSSSSTDPELWSMEEAGRQFVALATPVNEAISVMNTVGQSGSDDVAAYKEACLGIAEAEKAAMEQLPEGKWPAEVAEEIADFTKAISSERTQWSRCSSVESVDDIGAIVKDAVAQTSSDEAALVRQALSLPEYDGS